MIAISTMLGDNTSGARFGGLSSARTVSRSPKVPMPPLEILCLSTLGLAWVTTFREGRSPF